MERNFQTHSQNTDRKKLTNEHMGIRNTNIYKETYKQIDRKKLTDSEIE